MPSNKTVKSNSSKSQSAKFEEIQRKNQELLKERIGENNCSSDEEEDENIEKSKIDNLFKNYQGNDNDVSRIQQYFDGENSDCLICIRRVKAKDQIWNCQSCFISFHLLCIQKWANDSMNLKRLWYDNQPAGYYDNRGNYIRKKALNVFWDCPACRHEHPEIDIPRHYECFCKKERDPAYQEWLIPHSCGNMCRKPLEPNCGHSCTILCHPGKCGSCPQTIQTSCKCKKSPVKTIRCSQKSWSCSQKCLKRLSCGEHNCTGVCHGLDECPPCKEKSNKKCNCGRLTKEIKCEQESWSCGKICGKLLSCGVHSCDKKCHSNDCGDCPFGFERSCFCGKQTFSVAKCDESLIDSCGDTCLKQLSCGHHCLARCHKGDCDPCKEHVEKKCRCGATTKAATCSKELLCETKCNSLKSCKRHSCKTKCCVDCPPCSIICGKVLTCNKHKCEALCHSGNCYPCNVKQKVTCRCGFTSVFVRCGKGSKTKSVMCKELCKIPTKCHHDSKPHYCHADNCPKCKQVCGDKLGCGHNCFDECHDYVKVVIKDEKFVPAGPWDIQEAKIEYKKLPHGRCKTKIPITCLGGHETIPMDCSESRVSSCGRKCNRKLSCGNHSCQRECHEVIDLQSEIRDENCEDCELPCMKQRPKGCTHSCTRPCHDASKSCKKCTAQIKTKCFCGLTEIYYRCCDINKRDIDEETRKSLKEKYFACGARCIKFYPCGHQCINNCHPDSCKGADDCKKKVKLYCSCKNRKVEYSCDKIRAENINIAPCNEECEEKKRLVEEENQRKLQKQLELEADKNKRELEEFEKKFGPKKFKERKQRLVEEKKSNTGLKIAVAASIVLIISIILYFIFLK